MIQALKNIQMYADTIKDNLNKRGEKPQSLLMMNLDHIHRLAGDLLKKSESQQDVSEATP